VCTPVPGTRHPNRFGQKLCELKATVCPLIHPQLLYPVKHTRISNVATCVSFSILLNACQQQQATPTGVGGRHRGRNWMTLLQPISTLSMVQSYPVHLGNSMRSCRGSIAGHVWQAELFCDSTALPVSTVLPVNLTVSAQCRTAAQQGPPLTRSINPLQQLEQNMQPRTKAHCTQ
jgi:hypothetical protein